MSTQECDNFLDATGLTCPMPLLKTKQSLNSMSKGEVLYVKTTDAGSVRDFKSYISLSMHQLLDLKESDTQFHFWIQKG